MVEYVYEPEQSTRNGIKMKILYFCYAAVIFMVLFVGDVKLAQETYFTNIFRTTGSYEEGPYGKPSYEFSFYAMACCGLGILIALKNKERLPRWGNFLLLVNIGLLIFAGMMHQSPRGISLSECMWAWEIYGWGTLIWLMGAGAIWNKVSPVKPIPRADILDDL